MIAQTRTCGYTDSAPEKDGAGIGVPTMLGAHRLNPVLCGFFVREYSPMAGLYGVSSDTPFPNTRYANLYSSATPDWRRGRQVPRTCVRRHIMSNSIATPVVPESFSFDNFTIRAINRDGEIWFVAADVCAVLDIKNTTQALAALDSDERSMFNIGRSSINGGGGEVNIINESGLYALILRSRKPEAKRFRKWVTSEVLPAIRKTGAYSLTITKAQQGELATLIVERFPSGKDRPYAWSRFNNHFRLASYKDLPASKFEEACIYIKTMQDDRAALSAPRDIPLLEPDYFVKVRDIANKFIDDWSRVHKGEDVHPSLAIPDEVLAGIVAPVSYTHLRAHET